jgi:hypothetical protein
MRWPRMHGLPNRTSGSVVIRSRSETWPADIYAPLQLLYRVDQRRRGRYTSR